MPTPIDRMPGWVHREYGSTQMALCVLRDMDRRERERAHARMRSVLQWANLLLIAAGGAVPLMFINHLKWVH